MTKLPTIGSYYMPYDGPVASGIRITGYNVCRVFCRRMHLCYSNNLKERDFNLKWKAWINSSWQEVPINTQLGFN